MATPIAISQVYDTLLSSPGMTETVKLDMRVSRKALLLLSSALESGLKQDSGLFSLFGEQTTQELEKLILDCLAKAELTQLSDKLKMLHQI